MRRRIAIVVIAFLLWPLFSALPITFIPSIQEAKATDISSLPYTISESGTYYITGASSITGVGLTINADDVYVDGQHYLQTQTDASNTIYCDTHDNITIVNFNQNRTVASTTQFVCGFRFNDCTNVTLADSTFRRNGDNYFYRHCIDCLVDNVTCHESCWHGIKFGEDPSTSHNFTIQNCNVYNTTYWGFTAQDCYNFTWRNNTSTYTSSTAGAFGFITDGRNHNYTVIDCTSIRDARGFSLLGARNMSLTRFVTEMTGSVCVNLENASNIFISESNLTIDGAGNCINFADTSQDCWNVTIQQCRLLNSTFGVYTPAGDNVTYQLNLFNGSMTRPIFETGGSNHTILHNAYAGNTSDNALVGANLFVNDTALGLTVNKFGNGDVTPIAGSHTVNGGNWSVYFSASPDAGWSLTSFNLNGVDLGATSPQVQPIILDSVMNITFTVTGGPINLVDGLPSADVYVVYNSTAGNYVTINGSDTAQVLETNSNPVTGINNAITSWVPTDGVLVTNGTMADWSGTVLPSHGNFTWEAWRTNATATGSASYGVSFGFGSVSNVALNNLTLDGASLVTLGLQAWGDDNLNFTHCTITNCLNSGFFFGSCNNVTVQFCNATSNCQGAGTAAKQIVFNGCHYSTCANNTVNVGSGYGGGILDDPDAGSHGSYTVIANNTVIGWATSHGIYNGWSDNAEICDNVIISSVSGSYQSAICAKSQNVSIHGNNITCYGSSVYGISVFNQSGSTTFTRNIVLINNSITVIGSGYCAMRLGFDSSQTGFGTIKDIWVENCTVKGDWTWGILLQQPNQPTQFLHNVTITLCHIKDGDNGIQVGAFSDANAYIQNVTISSNVFSNLSGTVRRPIYVYTGVSGIIIHDNTFTDCPTTHGHLITVGSTSTQVYNNTGLSEFNMLNLTVSGSGTTTPDGSGWQYLENTNASVVWTPSTDYYREDFAVDGVNQSVTSTPYSINLTGNRVGIAYFIHDVAPLYGSSSYDSTFEGEGCTFNCSWTEDYGLSYGLLCANSSGSWVNRTAIALSGTSASFTDGFTLPSSSGIVVGYRFYANDSRGLWNGTAIYTLTTTARGSTVPSNATGGIGGGSTEIRFRVLLDDEAVEGCEIGLFEKPYGVYRMTVYTDALGYASAFIGFGEYTYIARFQDYEFEGEILHIEYEEITISLDEGQATVNRPSPRIVLVVTLFAVCLLAGAGYAFSKVRKMT